MVFILNLGENIIFKQRVYFLVQEDGSPEYE